MAEAETWRSAIKGMVVVKKYDRRGDLVEEVVRAGQKFQITPEERAYNSDLAASNEQDVFKNGMLQPVRLLDGTEDAAEIASNPNLIGESEMAALFDAHWKTFEAKLQQISNTSVLTRLLELAQSEEVDASLRQVKSIKDRIAELNPKAAVEREVVSGPNVPKPQIDGPVVRNSGDLGKPVTPS